MKSLERVKVGFIGAGSLANRVHYPSLSEMADVGMAALCDLIEERLQATGDRYDIPRRYTDYQRMLDEVDLDAVYVIMPPKHLTSIVLDCLARGKHVFTEKPPGFRIEDTRKIAQAAKEKSCKTMFGVNRRWAPVVMEARRRVLERGPVTMALGEFHKSHVGDSPYYESYSWLPVDVIHTVDTIQFMGGESQAVVANNRKVFGSPYANDYSVLLSLAHGTCGILLANYASGARYERFEVHGRGIAAYIRAPQEALIYCDGVAEPEVLSGPELAGSEAFHHIYGYFQENRHFIECIKEERTPDANFEYGVRLMELLEEIDRAEPLRST